jgi:hypothetical protein
MVTEVHGNTLKKEKILMATESTEGHGKTKSSIHAVSGVTTARAVIYRIRESYNANYTYIIGMATFLLCK